MVPRHCAPLHSFTRGLRDRENFVLVGVSLPWLSVAVRRGVCGRGVCGRGVCGRGLTAVVVGHGTRGVCGQPPPKQRLSVAVRVAFVGVAFPKSPRQIRA